MKANIVYVNFYDIEKERMSVGGIQTYLTKLAGILKELEFDVTIYQSSKTRFEKEINGIAIKGVKCDSDKTKTISSALYKIYQKEINEDDLLIFGAETLIRKTKCKHTIAIQHGIRWDRPMINGDTLRYYIMRSIFSYITIQKTKKVNTLVCVDYNYINWQRALIGNTSNYLNGIPNFTMIPEKEIVIKPSDRINIMFARRFVEFRGTRIFADAITRLLREHNNVYVTIAGEGPDESYFRELFDKEERVSITKYNSEDSLDVHADKHIAVIPTLGSEGTSLSLLEAMASKCAVVCTNVGGMTNIVIDSYNGLMISPNSDELYSAIDKLISNPELVSRLSENAYNTVANGFSYDIWKEKWVNVIHTTMHSTQED